MHMRFFLITFFILIMIFPAAAQEHGFEWAGQCGNPSNTTDDRTTLAALDNGQFYMAGDFLDTVRFNDKILVSAGGTDVFLAKMTPEGTAVWSVRIGGSDYDFVQKIVTGEDGNVYVSGYFYGTLQVGTDQYTSYGSQDLFLAKYGPDGNFLWSARLGGPMADYVKGLSGDESGNVALAGHFYDSIMIGDTTITAVHGSDAFTAKFGSNGDVMWIAGAGGSSSDQANSVTTDSDGNILLTASFYYDITFGDSTLTTANPVGVAIAKYSPSGQLCGVFQLDGSYLTTENHIATGPQGDFYLTGNFSETIVFGDKTFDAGEFNQDIFVAKYDAAMDLQWARHGYSPASDQVIGLVTDPNDDVFIAGHYLDTIFFDTLKLRYNLCCGSREIFIVKYDAGGTVQWGEQITGTRANIQSVALDPDGHMILSGMFTEELNFGPLTLSYFEHYRNYIASLNTGLVAGIKPMPSSGHFSFYPNPANERIWVTTDVVNEIFTYSVFNMNGIAVQYGKTTNAASIDVSSLPPGQYIVRITVQNGKPADGLIFIKK